MNLKQLTLSRNHATALRQHLKQRSEESGEVGLAAARGLGIRAASAGLGVRELAGIHETILLSVMGSRGNAVPDDTLVRRSARFFIEVIGPLEESRHQAGESNLLLTRRTEEAAATNGRLQQEIIQRQEVEETLRTSEKTTSLLLEQSRQLQKELRDLSRQLLNALEDERKRISRELHDVIAQTLAGINIQLSTLRSRNSGNSPEQNQRIAATQRLVEKSVGIVHRFARDLRPTVLDDFGLIPALKAYLDGFTERTRIKSHFTADPAVEVLGSDRRTVLFRVAQECLSYIAHRAKASQVEVSQVEISLDIRDGAVSMEIRDNGGGFQIDGVTSGERGSRLGVLGMKERVEMVEGTLLVRTVPAEGTSVQVNIPLVHVTPKGRRRIKAAA